MCKQKYKHIFIVIKYENINIKEQNKTMEQDCTCSLTKEDFF
jgi:hypothetical protein